MTDQHEEHRVEIIRDGTPEALIVMPAKAQHPRTLSADTNPFVSIYGRKNSLHTQGLAILTQSATLSLCT